MRFEIYTSLATENEAYLVRETSDVQQYSFIEWDDENKEYVFSDTLNDIVVNLPDTTEEYSKFFILFDYTSEFVENINDKVIEYVDAAIENDANYNTIVIGETNLSFVPDFELRIKEGAN